MSKQQASSPSHTPSSDKKNKSTDTAGAVSMDINDSQFLDKESPVFSRDHDSKFIRGSSRWTSEIDKVYIAIYSYLLQFLIYNQRWAYCF